MKEIKIGTSGWMYGHWAGKFYPPELPREEWLKFYAEEFKTVEINTSFYHLPSDENYENWHDQTPDDFVFSIKGSRYITHRKKLHDPAEILSQFLEGVNNLKEKIGPILFQLPPNLHRNEALLEAFIQFLPEDHLFTFEFRDSSWYSDEVFRLLELNNIALCLHDHRDGPPPEVITADFVYLRFHGANGFYGGSYSSEQLEAFAEKLEDWRDHGRSVFAYFNNDMNANAVVNAKGLMTMLE